MKPKTNKNYSYTSISGGKKDQYISYIAVYVI